LRKKIVERFHSKAAAQQALETSLLALPAMKYPAICLKLS